MARVQIWSLKSAEPSADDAEIRRKFHYVATPLGAADGPPSVRGEVRVGGGGLIRAP